MGLVDMYDFLLPPERAKDIRTGCSVSADERMRDVPRRRPIARPNRLADVYPPRAALGALMLPRADLEPGSGLMKPHALEDGKSSHRENLTIGSEAGKACTSISS